jgi:hypothetical protein
MNPHKRFNNRMYGSDLLPIILPIALVVFTVLVLNLLHKKNIEKVKPTDRQKITTTNVIGTVESIHPWGRKEIVPIKSVELEYFEYCDEWVMSGDVVQPLGRKNYFMPVLTGHLDLNVKDMTQTWVEYGEYWTGLGEDEKSYEDFRLVLIKVQKGKIIDINYTHYRLLSDNSWSIVSSWVAQFQNLTNAKSVVN